MDIVKLIDYGLTSFLLALVYFTYMLIKQEQRRKEPREKMFKIIKIFGLMCLFISAMAIAVNVYESGRREEININKARLSSCEDSLERLHTYISNDLIDQGEIKNYVQNHYEECAYLFLDINNK